MRERIETILLFVSVVIMLVTFTMTVWCDLFHKDSDTIRIEQEREERRLQREKWLKNME